MVEVARPASAPWARVVPILFALTLALLGSVSAASPASAHATMSSTWPANGQVLTVAPDHVLVEFSTEVSPDAVIAIVDPVGTPVTVGEPTVSGRFLSQRIQPTGRPGTYVAGIHVIAKDLHPIVTRLEFTVDPSAAATVNPAGAEPVLRPTPPADAAGTPAPRSGDHLRTVFPAIMIVTLAALAAWVLRRQSRNPAV